MSDRGAPRSPAHVYAGTGPGFAAGAAVGGAADHPRRTLPLTEQILLRLPGRRILWMLAWGLVPWLNLGVVAMSGASGWTPAEVPALEVVNRAAVTFALILSLWGSARIAQDLRRLQPALAEVVEQDRPDVERLFHRIDSIFFPLLLTAAVGLVLPVDELVRGELAAALIQALTWVFIGVPLCTALWVYLTLQIGLSRLGRGHLVLQGYRGDRSLGLKPVGKVAFTGFWMIFGSTGALVVTGFSDVPTLVVGCCVLIAGLGLFFFSLRGLHARMLAVKQEETARAVALYQEAYRKVRDVPSLEVLQQQAGLLTAAESLERRAERIQEWPFDEATFARVVTIASSVAAVIIARLILAPAGL